MQATVYLATAYERTPLAYYQDGAFCPQSISGSSWILGNFATGKYETDTTMTVSCS